jgi:hypothetical protein
MLAQVDPETAKSFIERVPEIIRAAATNPLALVALIVLVFGILASFLFRKASGKIKLIALGVIAICVVVLALVAIQESGKPPAVGPCKVGGFVYNEDVTPAIGLQKVKVGYVAATPANSQPVQVATSGPDGKFSFNCSQINSDAFPIHLRATFSSAGREYAIESEDKLVFGENQDVNLYLSLRSISNHYRLSKETMRIPSAELFKRNFVTVTNPATNMRLSTNKIAAIPRTAHIPADVVNRLRTTR